MWCSVYADLPERFETVMCQDSQFHVFEAIFAGPDIGFIDANTRERREVKKWTRQGTRI